jgi:NADH-quinone oxidoreductase subunit J
VSAELVLFWIFAVLTVGSSALVLFSRNPIAAAMALVSAFFFLAGIYVLLLAHTIAVLQVLVYAGAVMVLFLFVIMLLNLTDPGPRSSMTFSRGLGGLAAVGLLAFLVYALLKVPASVAELTEPRLFEFGTLRQVGQVMYTQWLFPFEATSLLLLVAIVGAVVVAKPRI